MEVDFAHQSTSTPETASAATSDTASLQYVRTTKEKLPWYKSFWKVLVLLIVGGVFGLLSIFGLIVFLQYTALQNGEEPVLAGLIDNSVSTDGTELDPTAILNYTPKEDDDPFIGAEDASVVIIGFEDFQCPFCAQVSPSIKNVVAQYPDDVKFVYRDFPLDTLHPDARKAAEAAECADEQGAFWPYHDLLYENQTLIGSDDAYVQWAEEVGLSVSNFTECLSSGRYTAEVAKDAQDATLAGVRSTPTFFINGKVYQGALSEAQFIEIIESEL